MHIQNVTLLRNPDATVSDNLTSHDHTILISIHLLKQFCITFLKNRFKLLSTRFVKKLHWVSGIDFVDKWTHVNVDRVSINRNHIIIICAKNFVHCFVDGLLCPLDRQLTRQCNTLSHSEFEVSEVSIT